MSNSRPPEPTRIVYDDFRADGGYTLANYEARWNNIYGPGEMAAEDTRRFDDGVFTVAAAPFRTGADKSVLDHIKYFGVSRETFASPRRGSLTLQAVIEAQTPGVQRGRVIHGVYGPTGAGATGTPYSAMLLDAQQASVTLHLIDFETGQLFDWLVSERVAMCLVERLPSSVTGSAIPVGPELMHTQIIMEHPITPGPHTYGIRFSRGVAQPGVEFLLDGEVVSRIERIGVPLDWQGKVYTGRWPALGPGEDLTDRINSFAIGHGLFSLLDAFPFQYDAAPEESISIPLEQRLFGQGAVGRFQNFEIHLTSA